MAQSMFNLDSIRKANQTYKNPTATPQGRLAAPTKVTSNASALANVTAPTVTPQRTETTLNTLQSTINKPYTYNPDSDPGYQAALKSAQQNLMVNQKNTNAQLRATGQGKSSYSETVANQLANQSAENIANNILPQYMQQDYARYQDNIANQQNLYGLQYQQDVTTPQNEAALTGNYLPPAAKTAIDNLLKLKTQAETKGITAAERLALSTQADGLRSQLKSMGVDPSAYGADKTAAQASAVNPGIRTLAAQGQDFSQNLATRQQNTAEKQYSENMAYQKARDAISDSQWQKQFDQSVNQFGLNYALQQLSQQNDQSYRQAQLALSQDDNYRAWTQLDYQMSQPQTSSSAGLTANQVLNNVKELYQEPVYTETIDPLTKQKVRTETGKTKLTTDPAKLTQMFETVVDAGLSETETKQILLSLGMSMKDIEARAKAYQGN